MADVDGTTRKVQTTNDGGGQDFYLKREKKYWKHFGRFEQSTGKVLLEYLDAGSRALRLSLYEKQARSTSFADSESTGVREQKH